MWLRSFLSHLRVTKIEDDDDDRSAHNNDETKEQLEHDECRQLRTQALVVVHQLVYLVDKL